jgi:hypothetical protein
MYVVRDVFKAKPGKAKDLAAKFNGALEDMQTEGVSARRILVETVSDYWTVVIETEVEDMGAHFSISENPGAREKMAGYMDFVEGGHREVFRLVGGS